MQRGRSRRTGAPKVERRRALASICTVLLLLVPVSARAFEISFPQVHQTITRDALRHVHRELNLPLRQAVLETVVLGNQHTDFLLGPHKHGADQAELHFNNCHVTQAPGACDASLRRIQALLASAIDLSLENPRLLAPRMPSGRQIRDRLIEICRSREIRSCSPLTLRLLTAKMLVGGVASYGDDPHTPDGEILIDLRDYLLPVLDEASRRRHPRRGDVRDVVHELNAYEARQLMGHALHAIQDVFAHSNVVELLHDQPGPPCADRFRFDPRCGEAITITPARFGDDVVGEALARIARNFPLDRATLQAAVAGQGRRPLQSGYARLDPPTPTDPHGFCRVDRVPEGMAYCHWDGLHHPALNKDKPGRSVASHANHRPAAALAQYVSEMAWLHFLRESRLAPRLPARVSQSVKEKTRNTAGVSGAVSIKSPTNLGRLAQITPPERLRLTLDSQSAVPIEFRYRISAGGDRPATIGARCEAGVDVIGVSEGRGRVDVGSKHAELLVTICPDSRVEPGDEQFRLRVASTDLAPLDRLITIVDDDRYPRPELRSVRTAGIAVPGAFVDLIGRHFQTHSRVRLNDRELRAERLSERHLRLRLPSDLAAGTHRLRVYTPTGGASRTHTLSVVGRVSLDQPRRIKRPTLPKKSTKPTR